jgi:hypothetical protein
MHAFCSPTRNPVGAHTHLTLLLLSAPPPPPSHAVGDLQLRESSDGSAAPDLHVRISQGNHRPCARHSHSLTSHTLPSHTRPQQPAASSQHHPQPPVNPAPQPPRLNRASAVCMVFTGRWLARPPCQLWVHVAFVFWARHHSVCCIRCSKVGHIDCASITFAGAWPAWVTFAGAWPAWVTFAGRAGSFHWPIQVFGDTTCCSTTYLDALQN